MPTYTITKTNGNYYVTNYTHTASNTNNMKWQFNFSLTNSAGKNCWIIQYETYKIGGWDVENEWHKMQVYCGNVNGMECRQGMDLTEYLATMGLGWKTNAWKTLNIPFVDDAGKIQNRKSERKGRNK